MASGRVAAWTWREGRRLADSLRCDGMSALDAIPRSPDVPAAHRPTVSAVLGLAGATCLVRSAVLQRWDADHDRPTTIHLGVTRGTDGYSAHAWLDGEPDGDGFVELLRRPSA